MPAHSGRIWFDQNPWPGGHAIAVFRWSGRLDRSGELWFDLHLQTVGYSDEAAPTCEELKDWRAPIVWNNFSNCILSSTHWARDGSTGIRVGSARVPFSFDALDQKELTADDSPDSDAAGEEQPPAFYIYLLGHDAVADHRISFRRTNSAFVFDIEWSGKIALTYSGDDEFKYSFRAVARSVAFERFDVDPSLEATDAQKLFAAACVEARMFGRFASDAGSCLRPAVERL